MNALIGKRVNFNFSLLILILRTIKNIRIKSQMF